MAKKHKISWLNMPGYTPQTWNPVVGCSKISEGCRNCYAERMARRLAMMSLKDPQEPLVAYRKAICNAEWTGQTYLVQSALNKPLKWKKPRAIFVNSMGDLFHESTDIDWIMDVLDVVERCPQHLFIILTKRAKRMHSIMQHSYYDRNGQQVLKNVWLGVTAENQAAADERVPYLLRTPSAVRFVSCEPMVGAVDLMYSAFNGTDSFSTMHGIDWVICGGESGPGARPMNPEFARYLRDQCVGAKVPFFFKQWGDKRSRDNLVPVGENSSFRVRRGGDLLDGRQWHQLPGKGTERT